MLCAEEDNPRLREHFKCGLKPLPDLRERIKCSLKAFSDGEKLSPQIAHLLESAKSLSLFDIETVQLLVDRLRKRDIAGGT